MQAQVSFAAVQMPMRPSHGFCVTLSRWLWRFTEMRRPLFFGIAAA
jgi:hypothetical protein